MKFTYKTSTLLNDNNIHDTAQKLSAYIVHLQEVAQHGGYDELEASINLPADEELLNEVRSVATNKGIDDVRYIIDIGIGGSNLGTKSIYDALFGYFDLLEPQRYPKMMFADTNDAEVMSKIAKFIETIDAQPEHFIINAISKSGGTTETIANFEIIRAAFEKRFGDIKPRLVITTDHGSKLYESAQSQGIATLNLPKMVGGRYSVMSAVGLFPLLVAGINIERLREGARDMRAMCMNKNVEDNPAALSASILFLHNNNGKNINDNFFFEPELESIGKWYRQLMGESVGKEHDIHGKAVYKGITPTVSIGSTDLHSMGQLYLGGPKDKVTTFIHASHHTHDAAVPEELMFPLVENITGKKASTIMDAIMQGTKAAYTQQQQPYMSVEFGQIDEYELGQFLQFKMMEMMCLGKLMEVNPFDQPHVELYKVVTKKILKGE